MIDIIQATEQRKAKQPAPCDHNARQNPLNTKKYIFSRCGLFWVFFFQRQSFLTFILLTVTGVVLCGGRKISPHTSSLCRLYFISFGIIEPILVILIIRYPLALEGICNLANYSVAYEETQSNRVSDFHDFVCSLFPKTILFDFYYI